MRHSKISINQYKKIFVLSVNRGVSESLCQWIVVSVNRVSVNRRGPHWIKYLFNNSISLAIISKFPLLCILSVFYEMWYLIEPNNMQSSGNFEIIATEIELLNKYLIQWLLLKQLFKIILKIRILTWKSKSSKMYHGVVIIMMLCLKSICINMDCCWIVKLIALISKTRKS